MEAESINEFSDHSLPVLYRLGQGKRAIPILI